MGYRSLIVERRGPVGWLVFNRPEAANAMDSVMLAELETAWQELDADPDVRVIVNTGRGDSFQSGLDVVERGQRVDPPDELELAAQNLAERPPEALRAPKRALWGALESLSIHSEEQT